MDSSMKSGLMAVCAVSGSVVFVAMHLHKRLLSKFMEMMEFEIANPTETAAKERPKKKVRFADETTDQKGGGGGSGRTAACENLEALPENWQAMYKEILQQRHYLRSCH